jgi:hypothetical protein
MSMKLYRYLMGKIQLTLLFALLSIGTFAQDLSTATLVWEADQVTDLQTQTTLPFSCQFKTHGLQAADWIQKNGARVSTYAVTGTEGTWADIGTNGSFTYLLSKNGNGGKMTIDKSTAGTFITLDFSKTGEYVFQQRFRVTTVRSVN